MSYSAPVSKLNSIYFNKNFGSSFIYLKCKHFYLNTTWYSIYVVKPREQRKKTAVKTKNLAGKQQQLYCHFSVHLYNVIFSSYVLTNLTTIYRCLSDIIITMMEYNKLQKLMAFKMGNVLLSLMLSTIWHKTDVRKTDIFQPWETNFFAHLYLFVVVVCCYRKIITPWCKTVWEIDIDITQQRKSAARVICSTRKYVE